MLVLNRSYSVSLSKVPGGTILFRPTSLADRKCIRLGRTNRSLENNIQPIYVIYELTL